MPSSVFLNHIESFLDELLSSCLVQLLEPVLEYSLRLAAIDCAVEDEIEIVHAICVLDFLCILSFKLLLCL